MKLWPAVFVSHGAPTMSIASNAPKTAAFLNKLGQTLHLASENEYNQQTAPSNGLKALVVVSAHWESSVTDSILVTGSEKPDQIYDFYGFPKEFYDVKYSARGSSKYAKEVVDALKMSGMKAELDLQHGLDHGVWVPLLHMMPQSNAPIIQVSLNRNLSFDFHAQLGKALRSLRSQGYIVIGSGGTVHNLGDVYFEKSEEDMSGKKSESWAVAFDRDLKQVLTSSTPVITNLLQFLEKNTSRLKQAHPRTEHLMPLVVIAAACEENEKLENLYQAFQFGTLGLAAYATSDQQTVEHTEL